MKAIIRKDEEAVSPVIATILMVAITVVLAAVLLHLSVLSSMMERYGSLRVLLILRQRRHPQMQQLPQFWDIEDKFFPFPEVVEQFL